MGKVNYLLPDMSVLPEVYVKVIEAMFLRNQFGTDMPLLKKVSL